MIACAAVALAAVAAGSGFSSPQATGGAEARPPETPPGWIRRPAELSRTRSANTDGAAGSRASAAGHTPGFRGHVRPSRQVELKTPIEEILHRIEVEEGARVKAGQTLAVLDDRLQVAAVDAARLRAESTAEIERAAVDLEEAEDQRRRIAKVFGDGAASNMELRRAEIAVRRAQAILAETQDRQAFAGMSLVIEERRLARYRIVAPFDGTVVRIDAEEGAMLTVEDPVLLLVDLDTLEAHVNLPASSYGRLTVGASYPFTAEGPVQGRLTGRLRTMDPIIDTASQTFRCVFVIENTEARLPAGFAVHLDWSADEPEAGPAITAVPDTDPPVTPRRR